MSLSRSCRRLLVLASAFLLAACGGGQSPAPPAASVTAPAITPPLAYSMAPADGAALPAGAPVVVRFSATMDPGSLALDSDFARQATASWSSTAQTNDTLSLAPPPGGWLGPGPLRWRVSSAQGQSLSAEARHDVTVPLQTFQAATAVIGQPDMVSDVQSGTPSARTLASPDGKAAIGANGELFIPDSGNHRVLRFALPPSANAAADLVLGQPDFQSDDRGLDHLNHPTHLAILGTRLAVTDTQNDRVLIWNTLPAASGTPADVVLGSPNPAVNPPPCDAASFDGATSAAFTPDGKLVVADGDHNRVLIWNQVPTADGTPPDVVLGQGSLDRCTRNDSDQDRLADPHPSARAMHYPTDLWTDGQRLAVVDFGNNRVLIWNRFPTRTFQPADLVLGQSDFVHGARNDDNQDGTTDGAPSARTLRTPWSVHGNGVQLAVADYGNNRVLIWDRFPSASFQPADKVLGQTDFSRSEYNDSDQDGSMDSVSARTVSGPTGVLLHGRYLVVTLDAHGGHRVLVFESP